MKITLVYLQGNQLWTGEKTVKRGQPFEADLDWFCRQSKLIRSRLGVVVDGVIHPPVDRVPASPKVQWDSILAVWKSETEDSKPEETEQDVPQKEQNTEQDVSKKKRRRGSK